MFLPFHWNTIKIFSVWELQSCQHSFTTTTTEDVHVLRLHEHVLRVVTSKLSRVNLTQSRRLDENILISQASKLIQFRNYWSLQRKLSQWSRLFAIQKVKDVKAEAWLSRVNLMLRWTSKTLPWNGIFRCKHNWNFLSVRSFSCRKIECVDLTLPQIEISAPEMQNNPVITFALLQQSPTCFVDWMRKFTHQTLWIEMKIHLRIFFFFAFFSSLKTTLYNFSYRTFYFQHEYMN